MLHLTQLEALIAVILGTGGIGRGAWGFVAAVLRRAAAIEGFRADSRATDKKLVDAVATLAELALRHDDQLADHARRLDTHDHQIARLEGAQWTGPPNRNLPPPVSIHLP